MNARTARSYAPRSITLMMTVAVIALGLLATAATTAAPPSTVNIVVSEWRFTPARIILVAGQTTTFRLTSEVGVHGIKSDDLGMAQTTITGSPVNVTFTPRRPGTYRLECSIFCGGGHTGMVLTVVVR